MCCSCCCPLILPIGYKAQGCCVVLHVVESTDKTMVSETLKILWSRDLRMTTSALCSACKLQRYETAYQLITITYCEQ